MKQKPNQDQYLVNFLKQNKPNIYVKNNNHEEQLMMIISKNNINSCSSKNKSLWVISSIFAVTFILIFGHLINNKLTTKMAIEQENLEDFIISSWQDSMIGNQENKTELTVEENWLLLTENNF